MHYTEYMKLMFQFGNAMSNAAMHQRIPARFGEVIEFTGTKAQKAEQERSVKVSSYQAILEQNHIILEQQRVMINNHVQDKEKLNKFAKQNEELQGYLLNCLERIDDLERKQNG